MKPFHSTFLFQLSTRMKPIYSSRMEPLHYVPLRPRTEHTLREWSSNWVYDRVGFFGSHSCSCHEICSSVFLLFGTTRKLGHVMGAKFQQYTDQVSGYPRNRKGYMKARPYVLSVRKWRCYSNLSMQIITSCTRRKQTSRQWTVTHQIISAASTSNISIAANSSNLSISVYIFFLFLRSLRAQSSEQIPRGSKQK
jgi:hypothetical protein